MSVTISGNEILSFHKNSLEIPDGFNRFVERESEPGRNLTLVFQIFYLALIAGSILIVATSRNHLAMHATKRFYFTLSVILFLINVVSVWNHFEYYLYQYPTTQPFYEYLSRQIAHDLIGSFFLALGFLLPCLAAELMRQQSFPDKNHTSFLFYIRSSFLTRPVAGQILFGYVVFCICLGIQTVLFELGYRYWGVWSEYTWLTQLSGAYLPFLAAFSVGFMASFTEETLYRIFAINWGRKLLKNTWLAVVASSLIWGFGHTSYPVYPMWFRGLEVGSMGLFLSIIYLRYGIIPTLVAHFVFDVFWFSSGFLFGQSDTFRFLSSIVVLCLPLVWALVALWANQLETERPLAWNLNKHQRFNLQVLKVYLDNRLHQGNANLKDLKNELIQHHWDVAVVDAAIKELSQTPPKQS